MVQSARLLTEWSGVQIPLVILLGTWYNGYYAIIFRDYRNAGSSPVDPTSSIAQLAERSAVNR